MIHLNTAQKSKKVILKDSIAFQQFDHFRKKEILYFCCHCEISTPSALNNGVQKKKL